MPNPNLIMFKSSTVSPFLKDCTVYIPYTQEKVFEHSEISNHVGDKELISFVGIGNEVSKGNIADTKNPKRPNVSPSLVEYIPKIPYSQYLESEISDLNDLGGRQEGIPPWAEACHPALVPHFSTYSERPHDGSRGIRPLDTDWDLSSEALEDINL
ncbi:hypothetical protein Tco_0458964 [Tanacetum coccineum]